MLGRNLADRSSNTFHDISETILQVRVMDTIYCLAVGILLNITALSLLLGQTPVLHDEGPSVGQFLRHSKPDTFISKQSKV